MEMSGQIHAPAALTPGKIPAVRTEEEVEWASELVLELWDILDAVTKGLGRVMAVAVRRWTLTVEVRVHARPVYVKSVVDKVALRHVLVLELGGFPCIIPPTLHTHISFTSHRGYTILATNNVVK